MTASKLPSAESTFLDLFSWQAKSNPDRNVVCYENEWLNYSELDRRSSAICGQLRTAGIKKGDRVGFLLSRGLDLPVVVVGILKAGATCIPLDPSLPDRQLESIHNSLKFRWGFGSNEFQTQVAGLDAEFLTPDFDHPRAESVDIDCGDGAYVLFTSGTTDSANAVLRTHRSLVSPLLEWIDSSDFTLLLRSPVTHGPFLWELLFPLASASRLVISPDEAGKDPSILARLIKSHDVTHLSISPMHLQYLVDSSELSEMHSLMEIETSGETLTHRLATKARKMNNAELYSTYGCTEAPAIGSHLHTSADTDIQYIGTISSNVELILLDDVCNPVAKGETGEIYVSGPGIASGYLNNIVETKIRFISLNPPGSACNDKRVFFKTGDHARELDDGGYEYLGRTDRQVQINGYRVELQEIEAFLNRHEDIKECYVMPRNMQAGNTILVGYLVAAGSGISIDQSRLREFLQEYVPDYKIPRVLIQLDRFPRNRHHKIDHRKLPGPETVLNQTRPANEQSFSDTEQQVAKIWSSLLNTPHLALDDDFFLVGGDSFAALSMLHIVKMELNYDIALDNFADATTIRKFSQLLK